MEYSYIQETVDYICKILHIDNNNQETNEKLKLIISYAILTGGHDKAIFNEAWDIAYKEL